MQLLLGWVTLLLLLVRLCDSGASPFDSLLREAEAALSRRDAQKALKLFSQALQLNSDSVMAMQGVAVARGHLGQHEASAEQWSRAAEAQPHSNELQYNAGMALLKLGRTEEAAAFFQRCRGFRPALIKLASISRDLGDQQATLQHLHSALALDPRNPDAYQYLGDTLNNMKKFREAVAMYAQALTLIEARQQQKQHGPPPLQEIIPILTHIGDAEMNSKNPDRALEAYRRALAYAHPSYRVPPEALAQALVGHFFAASEIGRWRGLERDEALLLRLPRGGPAPGSISPYQMLFLAATPEASLAAAASWSRSLVQIERRFVHSPTTPPRLPKPAACLAAPFTLGYLSRRFHDYPGTQLMLDLFAAHNRSRACICTFAHGPDDAKGEYRAVVASSSDRFVDIAKHTTRAAALAIASAGVDVLVEYDGGHDFNSMALLAHRPAEVHITWLGFAATTGQGRRKGARSLTQATGAHADAIDFLMADRHVLPVETATAARVSERLLLLPCYQPQSLLPSERAPLDVWTDPSARAALRRQLCANHLPSAPLAASLPGALWLCSFNRMGKMTPGLFASVMQMMRARPSAFLLVMAESSEATRELQVTQQMNTYSFTPCTRHQSKSAVLTYQPSHPPSPPPPLSLSLTAPPAQRALSRYPASADPPLPQATKGPVQAAPAPLRPLRRHPCIWQPHRGVGCAHTGPAARDCTGAVLRSARRAQPRRRRGSLGRAGGAE